MTKTLVMVRHGQSEWNLANKFTGWVDVDSVSYTHLTLPTSDLV